jgi:hypothetical protein
MNAYLYKYTMRSKDYNNNEGKWMYMLMTMVVMAVVMTKMMLEPPRILVVVRIDALC